MNENIIRTISSEMNRYLNNYLQEVLYKKDEIEKEEIYNDKMKNSMIFRVDFAYNKIVNIKYINYK